MDDLQAQPAEAVRALEVPRLGGLFERHDRDRLAANALHLGELLGVALSRHTMRVPGQRRLTRQLAIESCTESVDPVPGGHVGELRGHGTEQRPSAAAISSARRPCRGRSSEAGARRGRPRLHARWANCRGTGLLLGYVGTVAAPLGPERRSSPAVRRGFAIAVVIFAGIFVAGGFWELNTQRNGTPATATVLSCDTSYTYRAGSQTHCRGTWRIGDLTEGGEVQFGQVSGAGRSDVGKQLAVRVRGDTAHTATYRVVYVCFGVAALILVLGLWFVWKAEFTVSSATPRTPAHPPSP